MGCVSRTDRELFRKALIEVFAEKYDNALAESDDVVVCSEEHMRAMDEIVAQAVKSGQKKNRRKWLITLLVAAALLLSACTVYAYRGEIRDLVEKVYDKYICVTYREGNEVGRDDMLTAFYTLGYVPDGYELVDHINTRFLNQYRWESADGGYLVFEQFDLSVVNFSMDSEDGDTAVIVCDDCEVYCWIRDVAVYMWNDGEYAFKIQSSDILTQDMVDRLVRGLVSVG